MLSFVSKWLHARQRRQSAVKAAISHFEAATGNHAHSGLCEVIGEKDGNFIVRVCFGHIKPPRRKWYLIGQDYTVIAELSFDEVKPFGERGWR
jgi:hypothetical protein